MFPIPDVGTKPTAALLWDQLKTVLATLPLKEIGVEVVPAHIDWLATALTVGVGLMAKFNVSFTPGQLFTNGVTIT
jgi:hypothetical protein